MESYLQIAISGHCGAAVVGDLHYMSQRRSASAGAAVVGDQPCMNHRELASAGTAVVGSLHCRRHPKVRAQYPAWWKSRRVDLLKISLGCKSPRRHRFVLYLIIDLTYCSMSGLFLFEYFICVVFKYF